MRAEQPQGSLGSSLYIDILMQVPYKGFIRRQNAGEQEG